MQSAKHESRQVKSNQQQPSVLPATELSVKKPKQNADSQASGSQKNDGTDDLLDTPPTLMSIEDMVTDRIRAATDKLDLSRLKIFDPRALEVLKTKTELRTLTVNGRQFDNSMVKYFGSLPLTSLTISNTSITDDGVCQLVGMKNTLEKLDVDHQQIGEKGIKFISEMPKLISLNVSNNQAFNDSCIPHLAKLHNLKTLVLTDDFHFHGEGLKYLLKLPLSSLTVQSIQAQPKHLNELAAIRTLTYLDLGGTNANDATIRLLTQLPLTTLKISGCKTTASCLVSLAGCKTLNDLDISEIKNLTADQLQALTNLKNLTAIDLRETSLTNEYGPVFAQMKALKSINLRHSRISPAAMLEISKLPHLQELDLTNSDVGDDAMRMLRQSGVVILNLSKTSITDAGLLQLAGCKNLNELTLKCPRVTESGFEKFLATNKNQHIAISGSFFEHDTGTPGQN
jgi:hypothetical protein